MKIRISFWDDAPLCGALERLLPITFLEQASLSLPCLQMFLLTYLGIVLCVRMSGGKWFKRWQTIYHFLTPHQKGKIHDINSTKIREERCKSDKFPIFAFRMLPSSAGMRHVPRSEGQES